MSNSATAPRADAHLTYAEAAALTGCSESTIERDRKAGHYPGAAQDATPARTWRIPVCDLVAARRLPATAVQAVEEQLLAHREVEATRRLREQIIRLQEQLASATALAQVHHEEVTSLRALLMALTAKAVR